MRQLSEAGRALGDRCSGADASEASARIRAHNLILGQIHLDSAGDGHTKDEVCGDVELQVRLAHRYLARQVRSCGGNVERGISRYNGASACMVTVYSARVMATHRRLCALFGF